MSGSHMMRILKHAENGNICPRDMVKMILFRVKETDIRFGWSTKSELGIL